MAKINIFERVATVVNDFAPAGATEEFRKNVQAALRAALEGMELVTREELEVQEAVLARTREKLQALERDVAELRAALQKRQHQDKKQ